METVVQRGFRGQVQDDITLYSLPHLGNRNP